MGGYYTHDGKVQGTRYKAQEWPKVQGKKAKQEPRWEGLEGGLTWLCLAVAVAAGLRSYKVRDVMELTIHLETQKLKLFLLII